MKTKVLLSHLALLSLLGSLTQAAPMGTAFTYQGRLAEGSTPANGLYDFRFAIYDLSAGGSPIGGWVTNLSLAVNNGLFITALDFGPGVFTGEARWLEIGVKTNGFTADFFTLIPRQPVNPAPQSLFASGAGTAAAFTGPVLDSQLSLNVARLNSNQTFTGTASFAPASGAPIVVGSTNLVANLNAELVGGLSASNFWSVQGNRKTTPGTDFLGTTDDKALELKVKSMRALRLEPNATTPSLVGGSSANNVGAAIAGGFIGGGGNGTEPNSVLSSYGAIGGGRSNTIAANALESTIGGGANNTVADADTTIGGGLNNFIPAGAFKSTIGGGSLNKVFSKYSFIGGGVDNEIRVFGAWGMIGAGGGNIIGATNNMSTIAGGSANTIGDGANYGTIAGGQNNVIYPGALWGAIGGGQTNMIGPNSVCATIPGGSNNIAAGDFSLASGRRARAQHPGTFVWADSTDADFASTGNNQFLIRAGGGVGINKNNPATALDVSGTISATSFSGSGLGLTNISADGLVGAIHDGLLSPNIPRLNEPAMFTAPATFSAPVAFAGPTGPPFTVARTNVVANLGADTLDGLHAADFWKLKGNANTVPGQDFLGTTDNNALEFKVNGARALRLEPGANSPNVVAGAAGNQALPGAQGVSIGGGGGGAGNNTVGGSYSTIGGGDANSIASSDSTIGGGMQNVILANAVEAFIGGGQGNSVDAWFTTIAGGKVNTILPNADGAAIGGGRDNAIQDNAQYAVVDGGQGNLIRRLASYSTIGGGTANVIGGQSDQGTIGGGSGNTIGSSAAKNTIGGGFGNLVDNAVSYSVIAGGQANTIWSNGAWHAMGGGFANTALPGASYATLPGGKNNTAGTRSFAAGTRAKAVHDGSFVWADSTEADFGTTTTNQFLVRASGGMGINKNNPASALDVAGTVTATSFVGNGAGLTGVTATPADGSVTTGKLVDGAVTAQKLADGSVITQKLGDASVTSAKIADSTVASADLANDSVTPGKLTSDAASLARVTAGHMTDSGGNIGIGVVPSYKLHVNGQSFAQEGIITGQGTTGTGLRVGQSYSAAGHTVVTFATGRVIWNPTTKQVILTNAHAVTYVHFTGHKRETLAGATSFIAGYATPLNTYVLATLNDNGSCLVVDIAGRHLNEGFVHLYCFYDNGDLVSHFYYQCQ